MTLNLSQPIKLICPVQYYDWGKTGPQSLVARLVAQQEDPRPQAELWFGAHKKASAVCEHPEGIKLSDLIEQQAELVLGSAAMQSFGAALPFLAKVLSIAKPLSIQAHPDRVLATQLHQARPEHYPDESHKPEMAVALSPVSLLYGFKSLAELKQLFAGRHSLKVFAEELELALNERERRSALLPDAEIIKRLYQRILRLEQDELRRISQELFAELAARQAVQLSREDQLVKELQQEFPEGDVGILSLYMLNVVDLQVGESIFVGPNIPHAYLSGEIFECMANSDNVVRAGLTKKFQDVETLLSMLFYQPTIPEVYSPRESSGVIRYPAPVREFAVNRLLQASVKSPATGVRIVFVLSGKAELSYQTGFCSAEAGDCFLLTASGGEVAVSGEDVFLLSIP